MGGSAGPAFAASPAVPVGDGCLPTYDEAYYAMLDYYGNLTEGSIVKSYVLNGATAITDYGEYEDVANLTNSVVPQQNARQLAFDFSGESAAPTHFYFQGKTAQPYNDLPWKLSVSYRLNGVPTRAEELAGKTGVVEINVDAIPNRSISDYARHNYTLEAMAIFNQDDILSLEAPGAQVQLLGNLRAVLFVAFPGEEGHYSIRVGADKFEFGGMTFLMVPATLSQLDEISKLAQRKEDLEDNYEKLSGSLDALLDSLDSVSDSLYSSASGLDALNAARGTVSSGKGGVYAAADQALNDLDAMSEALQPLSGELGATSDALRSANDILNDMAVETLALRKDLNELNGILSDAQGSKEDLLAVIDNIDEAQRDIKNLSRRLDDTRFSTISGVSGLSRPSLGSGASDLSAQLETVKQVEQLYRGGAAMAGGDAFAATAMKAAGYSAEQITAAQSLDALGSEDNVKSHVTGQVREAVTAQVRAAIVDQLKANGLDDDSAAARADYMIANDPATQAKIAALTEQNAAAKVMEAVTAYRSYNALKGAYGAAQAKYSDDSFEAFVYALKLAQGADAASAAADAAKAANVHSANADGSIDLLADEAGQIGDEIGGMLDDTYGEVNDALGSLNVTIDRVNSTIRDINALMGPTSDVLDNLVVLCDSVSELRPLVESADDLNALAQKDSAELQSALDSMEQMQKLLDNYLPQLDRTLEQAQIASGTLTVLSVDTGAFLHSAEGLLQTAGTQLDSASRQSLASLAAALRGTAAALGEGSGVRNAKETINGMVEDVWNDYTGDVNDLLEMDATAEAVSLTDARNPAPSSVQVLIRTQEIKAADEQPQAEKLASAAAPQTTFWGRVAAMFVGMWGAIVCIFHRG